MGSLVEEHGEEQKQAACRNSKGVETAPLTLQAAKTNQLFVMGNV